MQILHEAPVLQHCATALEATTLELNGVAADAAGRLIHVQVETIDDACLLCLVVEGHLLIAQVQAVKLNWSEREWSGHFSQQSFAEINWIIKIKIAVF